MKMEKRLSAGFWTLVNYTFSKGITKAAFVLPANFTWGNSGGNILRKDYVANFDFSIFKVFPITERSKLQFRAEVFNLPNTAYFNTPNTNVDVAAGGKVTSTSNTPRQ